MHFAEMRSGDVGGDFFRRTIALAAKLRPPVVASARGLSDVRRKARVIRLAMTSWKKKIKK